MKLPLAFAISLAALALPATGHAAPLLEGQTVNYQYYFPTLAEPYSVFADSGPRVVGAGIEIANVVDNRATMDISDTNILIQFGRAIEFSMGGDFNGWVLSDALGTIPAFTGVTINPLTNVAGFDMSRVAFTADSITVNWRGLAFTQGSIVSLDISGAVPEPATWALMILGFGAIGGALRRRQRLARVRYA